jgi:hypothetical protein
MTIKRITIENIKGIEGKTFELDITPNKPSILVAPNGFGKSSIAVAFSSLLSNRISLHDDHYHRGEAIRAPRIEVEFTDDAGAIVSVEATQTTNAIGAHFDYFVINNQVKAKATVRNFGGRANASASMRIEPVILVDTVPARETFDYSYRGRQADFGANGRILPNIGSLLQNKLFIEKISENYPILDRLHGARIQAQITLFKQSMNDRPGTAADLRTWMVANMLVSLEGIKQLRSLADLVVNYGGIPAGGMAYLAAIQISDLYSENSQKFKRACKYSNYVQQRDEYVSVISGFNSSWREILPQERNGQLLIEFPHAHHISNGQRDILSFVALLHRARKKLRKNRSILIIDEVFDYLDDANLVAAQYYVTDFIETFKNQDKKIYPLILTHLNPYYFKNYTFSKQKTYYLDKRNIQPDQNLVQLIRNRKTPLIKDDVSKFLFHFHTTQINRRADFRELGLKETWGEGDYFDRFVERELEKYLTNQDFDSLAVCCGVRKRIEKTVHDQLRLPEHKTQFLDKHVTKDKLAYAESVGIEVPEYYYLLRIIYNDGLHWDEGRDNRGGPAKSDSVLRWIAATC